jgi:hypothetical protein
VNETAADAEPGVAATVVGALGAVAVTVSDNWAVAVCVGGPPSLNVTVKVDTPAAVGVPEIDPVEEDNVNPAGSEPDETDQAYVPAPPLAESDAEYGDPNVPELSVLVVTESAPSA